MKRESSWTLTAVLFLTILFTLWATSHFLIRWNEGTFFGEVAEMGDENFIINGNNNLEITVLFTEQTVFKIGRRTIDFLPEAGDRVIIVGSLNEKKEIEAKFVRISNEQLK